MKRNDKMKWSVVIVNIILHQLTTCTKSKVIYVREEENVTLECEGMVTNLWQVPPNFSTYYAGQQTNDKLPRADRLSIKIEEQPPQVNLHIRKFTKKYDEGEYKCIQSTATDIYYILLAEKSPKVCRAYKYPPDIAITTVADTTSIEDAKDIRIKYIKVGAKEKLKCTPRGFQDNYTFLDWEQKTEYGDRIRFLPDSGHGSLDLTKYRTNSKWFNERGYYVCSVDHGISVDRRTIVKAEYFLNKTGKPHFISLNMKTQFAAPRSVAILVADFISFPEVTHAEIRVNSSLVTSQNKNYNIVNNVTVYETIHDKKVALIGSRISVQLQLKSEQDFHPYTITLTNEFGSNSFTINLLPTYSSDQNLSNDAVYSVIPIAIIAIAVVFMVYRTFYKEVAVGGAVANEAYEMQNNVAPATGTRQNDVPVYSSIDRRDNLSLDQHAQTVSYCASKKKKPDPCTHRQIITVDEQRASCSKDNSQLNYFDVCFDESPGERRYKIHGIEKKNPYAEIDFSRTADILRVSCTNGCSDDEDFVNVEDVRQMKRKTYRQ